MKTLLLPSWMIFKDPSPKLPLMGPTPPEWYHPNGCNFCGSAKLNVLVPQYNFGGLLGPCHYHDWRYFLGGSPNDKDRADRDFKINMHIVVYHTWRWPWKHFGEDIVANVFKQAVTMLGNLGAWRSI